MSDSPNLLQTVRDEVRALDPSPRALRSFGLVVGGVLLAIGALLWWRRGGGPWPWGLSAVGALLVTLGAVLPIVLKPVRTVWMGAAFTLGFVMTRVLLTLAFVLAVTPTALVLRLIGKDLLHRHPDPASASYWLPRDDGRPDRESLERYF